MSNVNIKQSDDELKNAPSRIDLAIKDREVQDTAMPNVFRPKANFNYNPPPLVPLAPKFNAPGRGIVPIMPKYFYDALGVDPTSDGGYYVENDADEDRESNPNKTLAERIGDSSKRKEGNVNDESNKLSDREAMLKDFGISSKIISGKAGEKYSDYEVAAYEKYMGKGIYDRSDNSDSRALSQSNADVIANMTLRFIGTAAQAFTEPFVNMAAIPVAVANAKLSDVYDNEVTRGMDSLNESLKEMFPIFATKAQESSKAFSAINLSSAAFWDKITNGLAFTVGTVLNAMVTGGAISAIKGANYAKNIGNLIAKLDAAGGDIAALGKLLNNPQSLNMLAKGVPIEKVLMGAVQRSSRLTRLTASMFAASAEGGVEAREAGRELKADLDRLVAKNEITQDDADVRLERAMNIVYGLNTLVVGASTHIQFAGILAGKAAKVSGVSLMLDKGLGKGINKATANEVLPKTWGNIVRLSTNAKSTNRFVNFLDYAQYAAPIATSAVTESFEEGSQFIISKAVRDHYATKLGEEYSHTIMDATDELFSSKEGQESMLIGSIVGVLGSGVHFKSTKAELQNNVDVAKGLNTYLNTDNSRLKKSLFNHGVTLINNKNRLRGETSNIKETEINDLFEEQQLNDFVEYLYLTGSASTVKDYISETVAQEDEDILKDFSSFKGLNKQAREEVGSALNAKIDKLVSLRRNIDENYNGLTAPIKGALYQVQAFSMNTKDILDKHIQNLKDTHGVDVFKLSTEAAVEYQQEKIASYEKQAEMAYIAYKNGLGENDTPISLKSFRVSYDVENKKKHHAEYDESGFRARVSLGELLGDKVYDKTKISNINDYISLKANELIEAEIAKSNNLDGSVEASKLFAEYKNLQDAYINADKVIRFIGAKENQDLVNQQYNDQIDKQAEKDTRDTASKAVNRFSQKVNRVKLKDIEALKKEGTALLAKLQSELEVEVSKMESDTLSQKEKDLAKVKFAVLKRAKGDMESNIKKLDNKTKVADKDTNSKVITPETKGKESKPETKPESKEDTLKNTKDLTSGRLISIRQAILNDDKYLNEVAVNEALMKDADLASLVEATIQANEKLLDVVDEARGSVEKSKSVDDVKSIIKDLNLKVKVVAESVNEIRSSIATINSTKDLNKDSSTIVKNTNLDDELGLLGEYEQDSVTIAKTIANRFADNVAPDKNAKFSLSRTKGDAETRPDVVAGLQQISNKLFGNDTDGHGIIGEFIRRNMAGDFNTIWDDAFTMARVLDHYMETLGEATMNASMYNYLIHAYFSNRARISESYEHAVLDFRYLVDNKENSNVGFSLGTPLIAQFNEKHNGREKLKSYDYGSTVVTDRTTIKGNAQLLNLLNRDVVFHGATASIRFRDMAMTIGDKEVTSKSIMDKVRAGNLEDISLTELLELPFDIHDSKGNKVGRYPTYSSIEKAHKLRRLSTSDIGGLSSYQHEQDALIEARLDLVYYMANNNTNNIPTTFDHIGTGFLKSTKGDEGSHTKVDKVSANVRVKGSKILIAKLDGTDLSLYETGDSKFDATTIHNETSMGSLVNGIPYIAIPTGTFTQPDANGISKPLHMILPLQSAKLRDVKEGDLNYYNFAEQKDSKAVKDKQVKFVDKSKTIGERARQSVTQAIGIHIKLAKAKNEGVEDVTTRLTDSENAILKALTENPDEAYDITTIDGLNKYVSQITHTYQGTPIALDNGVVKGFSIDRILNRNLDREFSTVRITKNSIEIGKVENGIASVVSIYNDGKTVKVSNYVFGKVENTDDIKRNYVNLENANYNEYILHGVYDALATAYLRVDVNKLNNGSKHVLPLVNLKSNPKTEPVNNGNRVTVLYDTVIDENEPIDPKGINMDSYDDYAANTLKTDVATFPISETKEGNVKHIFSPFAVVTTDKNEIAEANRSNVKAKESIVTFKSRILKSPKNATLTSSDIIVKSDVVKVQDPVKVNDTAEVRDNPNKSKIVAILKEAQDSINNSRRGTLGNAVKQSFVEQLIAETGTTRADAQNMIEGLKQGDQVKLSPSRTGKINVAVTETTEKFDASKFYKESPATDKNGKAIEFKTVARVMSLRDTLNVRLKDTDYHMVYVNISNSIKGEAHILLMIRKNENLKLFGEEYVSLFNAISTGKGFIPFVSPDVLGSVKNRLKSLITTSIFRSKNDNDAITAVIRTEVDEWKDEVEDLEFAIAKRKDAIKDKLTNDNDTNHLAYLERSLDMHNSLITHVNDIVEIVIKDLLADNMVSGDFKKATLALKGSDLSSFIGESNDEAYSESDKEGTSESDTNDDLEAKLLDEGDNDVKEDTGSWDDGGLGKDFSETASSMVKKFLSGIIRTEYDSDGNIVTIRDKTGKDEIVGYKEAYSKVLRALSNKQHNVPSGLSTLKSFGEKDPFYLKVAKLIEDELANEYSAVPLELFKVTNKNRVTMKYLWLSGSNKPEGGRINKIGDSNRSDISGIIMNQWQAMLMGSAKFVSNSKSGEVTVNSKALKAHNKDFEVANKPIDSLFKAINESKSNFNVRDISNINTAIDSYNKSIGEIDINTGYKAFPILNNVKDVEDITVLRSKLNSALASYIKHFTTPVGFVLSDSTINSMINDTYNVSNGNANKAISYFLNKTNNFKVVVSKLSEMGADLDLNVNNIQARFKNKIAPILNNEAKHNTGVSPDSFRDSANKAIYAYTNYKYIDEVLSDLHDAKLKYTNADGSINWDEANVYRDINTTAFGSNSYLLSDLMQRINKVNSEKQSNESSHDANTNVRFDFEDSIVISGRNNKSSAIKIDEAEPGDIEVHKLMRFLNRDLDDGYFYYPTLSDGKTIHSLPMTKFVVNFDSRGKEVVLSDATINSAFEHIVSPEINRIIDAANIKEKGGVVTIKGFEQGSRNFILNPYLNKILKKDKDGKHIISTDKAFVAKLKEDARKEFEVFLNKRISNKLARWESIGVSEGNRMIIIDDKSKENKHANHGAYQVAADFEINYLIFNAGINQVFMGDTAAYWNGKEDGSTASTRDNMSKRLAGHRGPGEIGVSSSNGETFTVATVADIKLTSTASTFINSVSKSNDKEIEITDGQELTSLYEDMHNRVMYKGMTRALFNALYNDTDGVIYKGLVKMFEGTNRDENYNYEEGIEDALKGKDIRLYEEYMGLIHQPVKPMYFNNVVSEVAGSRIRSAVYIKSSSFPLRPSMTKNFAIDKLRKAMDYSTYQYLSKRKVILSKSNEELIDEDLKKPGKEGELEIPNASLIRTKLLNEAKTGMIDRVSFTSTVKLGANINESTLGEADITGFEQDSYEGLEAMLKTSSNVYPRKGFRIQQDLPFNVNKDKIGDVTQGRKLLFNGLFDLGNAEADATIKGLKQEFDAIYTHLFHSNYVSLMNELVPNGKVDYEKLNAILVDEGLSRGYDNNDIAELGLMKDANGRVVGFENKLMFHRRDVSIENLVLSIVKNRVIKIKFPGRSLVLGSEAGFKIKSVETNDHDRDGIVYTSSFDGELKSHSFRANGAVTINGKEFTKGDVLTIDEVNSLDAKDKYYYQPDQIIIPSYFKDSKGTLINLKEKDSEGNYKYLINGSKGRLMLDESKFDKETLRTFGFRIPNQSQGSMASIEIVGFTDVKAGELVIATRDFVLRMGSDFDVDKLYMKRFGLAKTEDGRFVKDGVGEEGFAINKRSRNANINRLLEIHHEVFSNPNPVIQKAIVTPLSYGFFKEEGSVENSNYKPDASVSTLFDTMRKGRKDYVLGEFIEELYGEEIEDESPLSSDYQADFYEKGKMGKVGIAMFSSRSVVNAILQQSYFDNRPIQMVSTSLKGKVNETAYDITLGGSTFHGVNFGNNKTVDDSGYTIAEVISWYQSTAVDNAKLNKLHKLNINNTTMDVINFLNQAGFHEQTLWFINQPIIREYAKLVSASQAKVGKPYTKDDAKTAVKKLFNSQSFADNTDFRKSKEFGNHRESVVNMAKNISDFSSNKEVMGKGKLSAEQKAFFGNQLSILADFLYIQESHAKSFRAMASVLNSDSQGIGANVNELVQKRAKLLDLIGSTSMVFKNIDSLIGEFMDEESFNTYSKTNDTSDIVTIGDYYIKPNGVVGGALVYSIAAFEAMFVDGDNVNFLQLEQSFKDAMGIIKDNINKGLSSYEENKLASELLNHYKRYAHSNALTSLEIDIEAKYNDLLIDEIVNERNDDNEVIGSVVKKKSLASKIQTIQKGAFSSNVFIASIVAKAGNYSKVADISFNNAAGTNDNDAVIIGAMYDLIDKNPILIELDEITGKPYTAREFLNDMFVYSEITGGIQRFSEIVKFIPYELKRLIGFNEGLNSTLDNKKVNNMGYLTQFLQHKPEYIPNVKFKVGDPGVVRLSALSSESSINKEGQTYMIYHPVNYADSGMITHLVIDPVNYGDKKASGTVFRQGNDVKHPPVIKTVFRKKNGEAVLAIYKLKYEPWTGQGPAVKGINGKMYSPAKNEYGLIYERVEELGNGNKSEYDSTIDIDTSKLSALNANTRVKYHSTTDLESAMYFKSGNVMDNVFGDFSKPFLHESLRHISNNNKANAVTRVMASVILDNNILSHTTIIKRSDLLANEATSPFIERLKQLHSNESSKSGVMSFLMDEANSHGYIVVNDELINSNNDLQETQNAFIHELLHFVVDRDNTSIIENKEIKGHVSRFKDSGTILVDRAMEYYRANRDSAWSPNVDIDFIVKSLKDITYGSADTRSRAISSIKSKTGLSVEQFSKDYGDYYGLINFSEFYSEMGSNDNFVAMMSKVSLGNVKFKDSNVITANYDTDVKDSLVKAFFNAFKQLFNDIINTIFKSYKGDSELEVKDNSIAKFAIYELIVSAKRFSRLNDDTYKLGFTNPLKDSAAKMSRRIEGLETVGEDTISKDRSLVDLNSDAKGETTLTANRELIDLNDDLDADIESATENETDADDTSRSLKPLQSLSRNLNSIVSVNSIATESYTKNDNVNTVDEKEVDKILKQLNKDNRLDYACKI